MNIKQRLAVLEACTKKQQADQDDRTQQYFADVVPWFDALIVRMEGREPTSDMSWAQQIACLMWTDPEAALRRLTEEIEDEACLQGLEPLNLQWPEGEAELILAEVFGLRLPQPGRS